MPYSCLALRPLKVKQSGRSESNEEYLFNISKANQIFNHLLRNQQIKLSNGHKIPLLKELKNKKYCKWHHSNSYVIINYVVFKNAIHKVLKDGIFKLDDHRLAKMTVDTDPFPSIITNMISTLGCNFHPRTKKGQ